MRLSALAYSPHLARPLAEETAAPPAFWRDRAERGALATDMATFVAADGDAFVGIVDGFMGQHQESVEIGGMWVAPARRRSGIGRELLTAILGWGRDKGASRAILWVRTSNDPARLLYEGAGFALAATSDAGLRLERSLELRWPS